MIAMIKHFTGRFASWSLLWGVGLYRAVLSPRKGYRCAHALVHGESCSDVALRTLRAAPVLAAVPAIQLQLSTCRATLLELESGALLDPALVQEIWRLMDNEGLRVAACEPTPPIAPP